MAPLPLIAAALWLGAMSAEPIRYLSRSDVEAVGLSALEVVDILEAAFRAKRAGDV